jgi:DNA-binding transcriptional LysR family regulator
MYDWAELRHFKYLLAILEMRGFRVAAEALHTSQPNLSVQARQFQENASIRLFRKQKNGRIRPTETGVAFMTLARLLLETRDEIIDALVAIERGEVPVARFGLSPMAEAQVFRELCAAHRKILPSCQIQPVHDDPPALLDDLLSGRLDAAVVSLPLDHPELQVEIIRRDRLVVCLREDHPAAQKPLLAPADLQGELNILYHPQRHPDAYELLLSQLAAAGLSVNESSRVSHPLEMQLLVREGYGFALIPERSVLQPELTVRRVLGTNWSIDTALVYPKARSLKTLPVMLRQLRQTFGSTGPTAPAEVGKKRAAREGKQQAQLMLLPVDPIPDSGRETA